MKVLLQPSFILHQRPYRDTSLIIEVLSQDYGRVGLVARGVRKSKSSLSALLQPFRRLLVSWTGKGDLGTLISAESDGSITGLNGRTIMSGYYINELLIRLLHRHDPHPIIFSIYSDVLTALTGISKFLDSEPLNVGDSSNDKIHNTSLNEERVLRIFEKNLLRELGYGLVLDHDVQNNEAVISGGWYHYYINKGPVAVVKEDIEHNGSHERRGTTVVRASNKRVALSGQSLLSFSKNDLQNVTVLREIKGLMRAVVNECLGGKPLHTRQCYQVFSSRNQ